MNIRKMLDSIIAKAGQLSEWFDGPSDLDDTEAFCLLGEIEDLAQQCKDELDEM